MSIEIPNLGDEEIRGRVAPIFLSYEPGPETPDLFSYSRDFYAQHTGTVPLRKKSFPYGFGLIAIIKQPDEEGKRALPPHECIAFDARQAGDDEYVWDISHADGGVQQVVRLWARPWETLGVLARTNRQGGLVDIFALKNWEAYAIEKHLVQRLKSPEAKKEIEAVYQKRTNVMESQVELVNERPPESLEFASAFGLELKDVPPNQFYENQKAVQEEQLKITGFSPLMLFNPKWFDGLNT